MFDDGKPQSRTAGFTGAAFVDAVESFGQAGNADKIKIITLEEMAKKYG